MFVDWKWTVDNAAAVEKLGQMKISWNPSKQATCCWWEAFGVNLWMFSHKRQQHSPSKRHFHRLVSSFPTPTNNRFTITYWLIGLGPAIHFVYTPVEAFSVFDGHISINFQTNIYLALSEFCQQSALTPALMFSFRNLNINFLRPHFWAQIPESTDFCRS